MVNAPKAQKKDKNGKTLAQKIKSLKDRILIAKSEPDQGGLNSYLKMIEDGGFDDRFCYGISQRDRGFKLLNPFTDPGALYCGKMGSGKSIAMKFTIFTHLLANSEKTIYILYDQIKGMADYKIMFGLKENVAVAVDDENKIVPVIEMLYGEMLARRAEFSKANSSNGVPEYEAYMRKKNSSYPGLARIVFAAEEFHTITSSEKIKFAYKSETEGTVAWKLKTLMRVGRSYGILILAATQRAGSDDFPASLRPGISMMMSFKVASANDVAFMGSELASAADIPDGMSGRCVGSNTGFMQFPFIPDSTGVKMIEKYYKPLKAKLIKYQMKDFHTAFAGKGNDGMVEVLDFETVMKNYQQYDFNKIAEKYLKAFGFELEPQENPAYIANFIARRDGESFAIVTFAEREGTPDKQITQLKNYLPLLKVDKIIAIFAETASPGSKNPTPGSLSVDKTDLVNIARVFDNRDKMTDDEFQLIYNLLPLSKKEVPSTDSELKKQLAEAEKLTNLIIKSKKVDLDIDTLKTVSDNKS